MADLVQDLLGGAVKKAFPDATEAELYGSSITFTDSAIILRCGRKEAALPVDKAMADSLDEFRTWRLSLYAK